MTGCLLPTLQEAAAARDRAAQAVAARVSFDILPLSGSKPLPFAAPAALASAPSLQATPQARRISRLASQDFGMSGPPPESPRNRRTSFTGFGDGRLIAAVRTSGPVLEEAGAETPRGAGSRKGSIVGWEAGSADITGPAGTLNCFDVSMAALEN